MFQNPFKRWRKKKDFCTIIKNKKQEQTRCNNLGFSPFNMKSFSTLLLLLLATAFCYSQTSLKGVVQHAETGAPVPSASIFLANTSMGTTAAANGQFTLTYLPASSS